MRRLLQTLPGPCVPMLALALATSPPAAGAIQHQATVQDCDRLAQPPRAAMGPLPAYADGVHYADLRWPAARAACERARTDYPDEVRFVAYAARAADKAGDIREAARLYRAAADEGNAVAENNLGAYYEKGEAGLARDDHEAGRLYRLAADQGYPSAQSNLGALYAQGRGGFQRDDVEAVRLWKLASEGGDAPGQNNLATMYAEGRGGLHRDLDEAVRLWRLAAAGGNTQARGNLRKAGRS